MFFQIRINRLSGHRAHTTYFALHFLLKGELTKGVHLILVDLKGVAGHDPLGGVPNGRSGVRPFGRTDRSLLGSAAATPLPAPPPVPRE